MTFVNHKKKEKLRHVLDRFNKGDFDVPIEISGIGEYKSVLESLEEIRLRVQALQDHENEIIEGNKMVIANITHDMKTPLALISGYAESIQCGMTDKDYPALIIDETAHLNEMVLKMIETARHDITNLPRIKEKVLAHQYFKREFENYINLAKTKHINIKIGKIPKVIIYIDKKEYARVIQNLVTNAIKYAPTYSTIHAKFTIKNNFLQIIVKDNGIGIDQKDLPYIFDNFYRVDEARTTADSGLGLSIVKTIVENYGGTIKCKSKFGSYTKFIFTIPIFNEEIVKRTLRDWLGKTDG